MAHPKSPVSLRNMTWVVQRRREGEWGRGRRKKGGERERERRKKKKRGRKGRHIFTEKNN